MRAGWECVVLAGGGAARGVFFVSGRLRRGCIALGGTGSAPDGVGGRDGREAGHRHKEQRRAAVRGQHGRVQLGGGRTKKIFRLPLRRRPSQGCAAGAGHGRRKWAHCCAMRGARQRSGPGAALARPPHGLGRTPALCLGRAGQVGPLPLRGAPRATWCNSFPGRPGPGLLWALPVSEAPSRAQRAAPFFPSSMHLGNSGRFSLIPSRRSAPQRLPSCFSSARAGSPGTPTHARLRAASTWRRPRTKTTARRAMMASKTNSAQNSSGPVRSGAVTFVPSDRSRRCSDSNPAPPPFDLGDLGAKIGAPARPLRLRRTGIAAARRARTRAPCGTGPVSAAGWLGPGTARVSVSGARR